MESSNKLNATIPSGRNARSANDTSFLRTADQHEPSIARFNPTKPPQWKIGGELFDPNDNFHKYQLANGLRFAGSSGRTVGIEDIYEVPVDKDNLLTWRIKYNGPYGHLFSKFERTHRFFLGYIEKKSSDNSVQSAFGVEKKAMPSLVVTQPTPTNPPPRQFTAHIPPVQAYKATSRQNDDAVQRNHSNSQGILLHPHWQSNRLPSASSPVVASRYRHGPVDFEPRVNSNPGSASRSYGS